MKTDKIKKLLEENQKRQLVRWKVKNNNMMFEVNGGADIAGIPIPIQVPLPEFASTQSEIVQSNIDQGNNLKIMEDGFYKVIESIDTTLPPGPTSGFQDPTFAIELQPIINLLVDLGIPDPITWI